MRVATELEQEMELAMRRLDQLINQADQRAKDAEDKASDAVTAISMVKIPEQKKVKLNNRDAEKFWPETYTAGPRGQEELHEDLKKNDETYFSVLAPGLLARLCWCWLPPSVISLS